MRHLFVASVPMKAIANQATTNIAQTHTSRQHGDDMGVQSDSASSHMQVVSSPLIEFANEVTTFALQRSVESGEHPAVFAGGH